VALLTNNMGRSFNIPLIALVLVIGYVFFSTFSGQTGFAAASCSGNSILEVSPNKVQVGEPITATVKGLNNCLGQQVLIKEDSDLCNGQIVASYKCTTANCDNKVTFYKGSAKQYALTACVDKDKDGYLIEQGERSTLVLTVTELPDLKVNSITYSMPPKNNYGFTTKIELANIGVRDTTDVNALFEVITQDSFNRATVVASKKYEDLKILQGTTLTLITPQVTLTKGDYIVKVTVDQTNLLQENNELNNVLQQPLIIG